MHTNTRIYYLIPAISTVVLVGIFYAGTQYLSKKQSLLDVPPLAEVVSDSVLSVEIDGVSISLEIADNEEKRMLGLGKRPLISENTGMIFIFDEPDRHGIWMKDMNFPVDIIWLDENKQVVDHVSNASPDDFPVVMYPDVPAMYVIELPAGTWQADSSIVW